MNITWMCCARVVTGLGVGSIDAVIPVWSSEVSSHQARGSFLAFEFFLNILGLALAYWIEIFTGLNSNQVLAWRVPISLQIIFLICIMICIPFFPESPRWLAKVGRVDEARDIIHATRSGAKEELEAELREILHHVKMDRQRSEDNHYSSMIFARTDSQKQLRARVVLSVWLQIMQELVGIGVITVYAVNLIQGAGFGLFESKLLAGTNNISYMFSVLFAVFTLDRCGRRSTMVWGALGMALFLLIGGILDKYAQQGGINQRAYGGGVVAMVFFYTATFGATWLVTPWLYPTELFPTFVRAKGGAWAVVGFSIGNGVVTMITPFLFDAIKYGVLLLLMGLNIFVVPFIIFLYPETSGRPLEQIDDYFCNSSSWNVLTASRQIRDKNLPNWQWTRKYQFEHASNGNQSDCQVAVNGIDNSSREAAGMDTSSRKHGNGIIGKLIRKASYAGLL